MDPPSPAMEINEIRWWSVSPLHSRGFRWALNEFMYDLTQPIIIIDLFIIVRSLDCTSGHLLVLKIMPSCTRNTVVWCHCDFWTTSGVFVRLFHFQPILSLSLFLSLLFYLGDSSQQALISTCWETNLMSPCSWSAECWLLGCKLCSVCFPNCRSWTQ